MQNETIEMAENLEKILSKHEPAIRKVYDELYADLDNLHWRISWQIDKETMELGETYTGDISELNGSAFSHQKLWEFLEQRRHFKRALENLRAKKTRAEQ